MKIEGVIFDLDGTLLDSTWVWSQIDTDFLKKRGFEVPKDYSTAIMAMGFEDEGRCDGGMGCDGKRCVCS